MSTGLAREWMEQFRRPQTLRDWIAEARAMEEAAINPSPTRKMVIGLILNPPGHGWQHQIWELMDERGSEITALEEDPSIHAAARNMLAFLSVCHKALRNGKWGDK